jgi:hypothetical protein
LEAEKLGVITHVEAMAGLERWFATGTAGLRGGE